MFKDYSNDYQPRTHLLEHPLVNLIAQLLQEKAELERGVLAPDGAWIETGMVAGRQWRQAYWRATDRIFDGGKVKRKYIGKAGSTEHQEAQVAVHNRKRLRSVINQLKILGEEL